jgi:hypothetical protein
MDAKEAIQAAQAHLKELEPPAPNERLELEEIALSSDELSWLVTFAVVSPAQEEGNLLDPGVNDSVRILLGLGPAKGRIKSVRTIKLRADDGAFLALKNAS